MEKTELFKQGIEILSTMFQNVELLTLDGGLAISVVDHIKSNYVCLKIKKQAIKRIKKSNDKTYLILEQLNKVLKRLKSTEDLSMEIIPSEQKMKLEFVDTEENDKKRTFKLMTLAEENDDTGRTRIYENMSKETKLIFKISPKKLGEILGDLEAIDAESIQIRSDGVNIYVQGNTDIINNESEQKLHLIDVTIIKTETTKQEYPISLLKQLAKLKLPLLTLRLESESPLYIDASSEEIELQVIIAPTGMKDDEEVEQEQEDELGLDGDLESAAKGYL